MMKAKILENKDQKILQSENYNFLFDKNTGFFARWGKKKEDNPDYSPFGPEIADIEVTTICKGITDKDGKKRICDFCYKSNTPNGENMTLETFKKVFDKINRTKVLTQIAFGADSEATNNPDLFKIMEYCRANGVVPNITVADITDETADQLAKWCGAVAVSAYFDRDKNVCYNTIKKLTDSVLKTKLIVRKKKKSI